MKNEFDPFVTTIIGFFLSVLLKDHGYILGVISLLGFHLSVLSRESRGYDSFFGWTTAFLTIVLLDLDFLFIIIGFPLLYMWLMYFYYLFMRAAA